MPSIQYCSAEEKYRRHHRERDAARLFAVAPEQIQKHRYGPRAQCQQTETGTAVTLAERDLAPRDTLAVSIAEPKLEPGASTTAGARMGWGEGTTLLVSDAEAIAKQVPGVHAVAWYKRGVAQLQAQGQNWSTQVWGVPASYVDVREWPLVGGEFVTAVHDDTSSRVVVLGKTVADMLFGLLFTAPILDVAAGPPDGQGWRPVGDVMPGSNIVVEVKSRTSIVLVQPNGRRVSLERFPF